MTGRHNLVPDRRLQRAEEEERENRKVGKQEAGGREKERWMMN